jgi:hypothetical protein
MREPPPRITLRSIRATEDPASLGRAEIVDRGPRRAHRAQGILGYVNRRLVRNDRRAKKTAGAFAPRPPPSFDPAPRIAIS